MKPNILVCGKTGSGKTSLIQAITDDGTVPESAIGHGAPATRGFQVYSTPAANFIDTEGFVPGQSLEEMVEFIRAEMRRRLASDSPEFLVHCIWFCVDGSGARITDAEMQVIRHFSSRCLLVLTKMDLLEGSDRGRKQREELHAAAQSCLDASRIVIVSAKDRTGLKTLVEQSENLARETMLGAQEELRRFWQTWEGYFRERRQQWLARAAQRADEAIRWAAGRAAAIAIVPIPLADVGPLVLNEIYMIHRIGNAYGISVTQSMVAMLLGASAASTLGKILASFLPGFKIPIAAAITYGLGKGVKAYFESGMELSPEELKILVQEETEKARKNDFQPIREE